jgi:plastocyanin
MLPNKAGIKKNIVFPAVLILVVVGLFGSVVYSPSSKETLDNSSSVLTSSSETSSKSTTSQAKKAASAVVLLPLDVGQNRSLNFEPPSIRVVIGVNNTVVWMDEDPLQHTVTSLSIPHGATRFDSGILNQGQSFTWTFTVPGTYRYYCTIHPDWMRATITVIA